MRFTNTLLSAILLSASVVLSRRCKPKTGDAYTASSPGTTSVTSPSANYAAPPASGYTASSGSTTGSYVAPSGSTTGSSVAPSGSIADTSGSSSTTGSTTGSGSSAGSTDSYRAPSPSGASSGGIQPGNQTVNFLPSFGIQVDGQKLATSLTMDANWRWVHQKSSVKNCFTDGKWDAAVCSDPKTCAANCVLEGISQDQYATNYGVSVQSNQATLKLKQGTNVGSRMYVVDPTKNAYYGFALLNREFTFTVDVSKLGCGLNGALYLVSMDLTNKDSAAAGPAYGTGYGDAQCPSDVKYVNGLPNVDSAKPFRACSAEMDIWEANSMATALTPHPCKSSGVFLCKDDAECGIGANKYNGVCDKDGADFNPYRSGQTDLYGPGKTVDTTKPVTVITQFITSDGTDNGDLVEIKRFYKQGSTIIAGGSVTDKLTEQRKTAFGDNNHFAKLGGLKAMGASLKEKMVLVLSVWGDAASNMVWLDSTTAPNGASTNGTVRGACPAGGSYEKSISDPAAAVSFSDMQVGKITTKA